MNGKNIIFHVTKKYMKLNRRRTAIAFVGIVFMVMLMTCVFAGRRTVMDYLQRVASIDKGSWHIIVRDITPEEAECLETIDAIESKGYSTRLGCLEFPQTGDSVNKPFLNVRAYSPETCDMTNIRLTEGRMPENEHEIVISGSAIADGSTVKMGDTISCGLFKRSITSKKTGDGCTVFPFYDVELPYGGTVEVDDDFISYEENDDYTEERIYTGTDGSFTVVGIMEAPNFENRFGACYSALCGYDFRSADSVSLFMILDLGKIGSMFDFRQEISQMLHRDVVCDTNELLLAFAAKGSDSSITGLTVFIEVFFTVLIMAASVVLIYNVFNMSFAERTKYLGMLSSVGATGKQKRQSIYYECVALLIPALPVGILTGLGVITGGMKLIKPNLDKLIEMVSTGMSTDIPVKLSMGPAELCLIIGMCIVTVMVSALIPAVKISRIGPVESIRGNTEKAKKKRFATKKSLLERGKPEMLLAVNGTSRSKHLTKGIVRSVAAFAVLTMVTLYGAKSVINMLDIMTEETGWDYVPEGYSYYIAFERRDKDMADRLEEMMNDRAVTKKKEIIYATHMISGKNLSAEFLDSYREIYLQYADNSEADWENYYETVLGYSVNANIIAVDDEEFVYLAKNGDADMSIAENTSEPAVLVYDNCILSTDYYRLGDDLKGYKCIEVGKTFAAQKGDDFSFEYYSAEKQDNVPFPVKTAGCVNKETVADRYRINADAPYVFINRSACEQLAEKVDLREFAYIMFSADNDTDGAFVSRLSDICEQTMNTENEVVMGKYAERNTGMNIKQIIAAIIRILAYCFTALISAVCLLNLYNSIRGRTAERTKETAVLRSVGMTDRQLVKMNDLENLMLFGKGIGAAAVICAALILLMYKAMTALFGRIELPVPWLLAGCIAAVIFAASSIITRICSRSADNSDIIEKIRRETV